MTVNRNKIYSSVLSIYKKECVLNEYPFRIKFEALDTGGVSRDMFSAFLGSTLVTLLIHPEIDVNFLLCIGTIISQAYMASGILPVRIAFTCLAAMLLPSEIKLPDNILIDAFIDNMIKQLLLKHMKKYITM